MKNQRMPSLVVAIERGVEGHAAQIEVPIEVVLLEKNAVNKLD